MGVLKVLAYSHRYLPVDGCKYSRFLFSVNAKVALSAMGKVLGYIYGGNLIAYLFC